MFRFRTRVCDQVKDLIHRCLQVDVDRRIKLQEILQHPWILSAPDSQLMTSNQLIFSSTAGGLLLDGVGGGMPIPSSTNNLYHHNGNRHHQLAEDGLNSVGSSNSSPMTTMDTMTSTSSTNMASTSSVAHQHIHVKSVHYRNNHHNNVPAKTTNMQTTTMSSASPVSSAIATRHLYGLAASGTSSHSDGVICNGNSVPSTSTISMQCSSALVGGSGYNPLHNSYNISSSIANFTRSSCARNSKGNSVAMSSSVTAPPTTVIRMHVIDHLASAALSASRPMEMSDLVDKVSS